MGGTDLLAGLSVDRSLSHVLEKAEEKHTGWLRVEIVDDKFKIVQEGKQAGSMDADFAAVAATLAANPCYFLLRAQADRWICLVFLPGGKAGTNPKNRLYAASAPAVQYSVGNEKAKVVGEYFFESVAQCKHELYVAGQKSAPLLTEAERLQKEVTPYGVEPVPLFDIADVKLDDAVVKALEGFKAGSVQTVFISLNPAFEFVVLHSSATAALDAHAVRLLNKTHPAFVLHKLVDAKTNGAPRDVFIHFVPKLAPAKLKLAYASQKGALLHKLLGPAGLPFILEVWKLRHVTQAAILEEMFPKPPPPGPPIKKPMRRGKGRARLVGHTKFRDDGVRIHTPHNSPSRKSK